MKQTYKIHLHKQVNGKQVSVMNECGRRDGKYGSIRMVSLDRFVAEPIEHQCSQCRQSAINKGLIK